jgi:3-oxoacyl-[acyl-carrier protein] reductase
MNLNLDNKTAIVTGSARGIGASIARLLASEGANVVITDISADATHSFSTELNDAGYNSIALPCDVTDEDQVEALVQATVERFGGVDILVNNAGFCRDKKITRMDVEDWDSVITVNLKGPWLCSRAAIPHMAEQQWGRIVNISSRAHWGNPGQCNYSSAKAGVIGLTRSLAMEQGRHNITVNSVAPGIILTEALKGLPHFEKIAEAALEKNTVPRLGEPEDVANTVAFLCSDLAGYINGELIHVTGGRFAG